MDRIQQIYNSPSSAIIDLRSPKEYALGHVTHAINLPLLDNEERHIVGLTYKQQGKSQAMEEGLVLFAAKAERFLEQVENIYSKNQSLIVYCWRGGLRSSLVGRWLRTMGFSVHVLEGGYKKYRRDVLALLDQLASHPLIVLIGKTGCGKSSLIRHLISEGRPALDLEGLAEHRGSVFGDLSQKPQSITQQQFENDLATAYFPLREAQRIVIELETVLGNIYVGTKLKKHLRASPKMLLQSSFEKRQQAIIADYAPEWNQETRERFIACLQELRHRMSRSDIEMVETAANCDDLNTITQVLLEKRYDPCYEKSLRLQKDDIIAEIDWLEQPQQSMASVIAEQGRFPN